MKFSCPVTATKPPAAPRLARLIGSLSALALISAVPAARAVDVSSHVDIHAHVDLGARVAVPVPVPAPPPVVHVHVPAPPPPPVVHVVHEAPVVAVRHVSEIYCEGSIRYQVRSGAWVTRERCSAAPIELPLCVEAAEYPCRIVVPGVGDFEAAPRSRFTVDMVAPARYCLNIERGGVRYSVSEAVSLRVISPRCGVDAFIGGVSAPVASRYCVGRAVIDSSDVFQVYSVRGGVRFEREGRRYRDLAAGHSLSLRLAVGASVGAGYERFGDRYYDVRERDSGIDDIMYYKSASSRSRSVTSYRRDDYDDDDDVREGRGRYKVEEKYERKGGKSEYKYERKGGKSEYKYEEKYESKGNGKGKGKVEYRYESSGGDTHGNGRGRGHEEHGNGKGKGHGKH